MTPIGTRWLAAAVVVSGALLCTGVGIALSTADDPKAPDLSELRDTVKAASKRGENVDEIRKALDALEKSLAKGWTAPKPGEKVAPSPELTALRDAVEVAGKKGENVEEIRKQLEAVELAMTGKTFTRPKPLPPVDPPVRPVPPNQFDFPPQIFPNPGGFGGVGGVDRELFQKAQELRMKALEMMLKAPNDADAAKLMQEAQELMLKAMGNRGLGGINPNLMLPEFGRAQDRFRLGIRMERLAPITAEQLGLDNQGVAITSVIPGSAAERAGFKVHDVVIEFAGKAISENPDDLSGRVTEAKGKVDAVVIRKGKKVEIKGIDLPDVPQVEGQRLPNFQPRPIPLPVPDLQPRLPRPVPDLAPRPNAGPVPPPNPLGRNALGGDAAFSFTVANGEFTLKASQAGVRYTITGTKGDDGPVPDKISVTDGDKTHEAKKVDELPKEYQAVVERLLKAAQARARR